MKSFVRGSLLSIVYSIVNMLCRKDNLPEITQFMPCAHEQKFTMILQDQEFKAEMVELSKVARVESLPVAELKEAQSAKETFLADANMRFHKAM